MTILFRCGTAVKQGREKLVFWLVRFLSFQFNEFRRVVNAVMRLKINEIRELCKWLATLRGHSVQIS